jgi:hypothetical protein
MIGTNHCNKGGIAIMRRNCITLAAILALVTLSAAAQEDRSEIGLQGNGFFTRSVSGRNLDTGRSVSQRATESGGFLLRCKYHINRWLSADANYGFKRLANLYSDDGHFPPASQRAPSDDGCRDQHTACRQAED